MSIGFLKRLLFLANIGGVLILASAAYGYWTHSQRMAERPSELDFRPTVRPPTGVSVKIADIGMPLGLFPEPRAAPDAGPVAAPTAEIQKVLDQLGDIINVVQAEPPYTNLVPAITFKLRKPPKADQDTLTIRLGEALENGGTPLDPVPLRYKFVGLERDPQDPRITYFLFDMNCDGEDIQKARWYLEVPQKTPEGSAEVSPTPAGFQPVTTDVAIVRRVSPDGTALPEQPESAQPTAVPVAPEPPPPTPRELRGQLFEDAGGTFEPTREGVEYLKENYEKLIGDAQASTWRDPQTGRPAGVRVSRIREGSAANAFGILPDDVILAINDITVSSKDQAVSVVKRELKKNVNIIRVRVLRLGRTLEMRFDTRDPDTRRAARSALK